MTKVMKKTTLKQSPSMLFDILTENDPSRAKTKLRDSIELTIKPVQRMGMGAPDQQKKMLTGVVQLTHDEQIQALQDDSNRVEEQQLPQDDRASGSGESGRQTMEEEDAIENALRNFTPELILKELLGSLFVHPDMLENEEMLGEGAYATVRRASMASPDGCGVRVQVAIKRLKPEVLKGADDLKEFLMEGNLMRKLRHPHIVSVLGIGASELQSLDSVRQSTYLVMEAADGGDLKTMVIRQMTGRSAAYDADEALQWCIHLSSAMSYLHQVCKPIIIHRDLKLENCLLTSGMGGSRVAKLADFGLHKRGRTNNSLGTPMDGSMHHSTMHGANSSMHDRSYYGGTFFTAAGGKPSVSTYAAPGRDASLRGGTRSSAAAAPLPLSLREQASKISGEHGATASGEPKEESVHERCDTRGGNAALSVLLAQGYVQQQQQEMSRTSASRKEAQSAAQGNEQQQQQAAPSCPWPAAAPQVKDSLKLALAQASNSREPGPVSNSPDSAMLPGMVASDASLHRKMLALLALDRASNIETEASAAAAAAAESCHWAEGPDTAPPPPPNYCLWKPGNGALPMSTIEEQEVSKSGTTREGGVHMALLEPLGQGEVKNSLFQGPLEQQTAERGKQGELDSSCSAALTGSGRGSRPPLDMRTSASRGGSKRGSSSGLKPSLDSPSVCAAAVLSKGKSKASWNFADATQQVGSLMYMAPELFNGHVYNEKVDVFSFSILAFELFTGRLLAMKSDFMARGAEAVEEYVKRRAEGEREKLPGSWPVQLQRLIASCWDHDPARRPAFNEVLLELESIQRAGLIQGLKPRADLNSGCCTIM